MSIQKVMDMNVRLNRVFESQRKLAERLDKINSVTLAFERQMAPLRKMEKVLANQKRFQRILRQHTQNTDYLSKQLRAVSRFDEFSKSLSSNLIQQYSDDAIYHILASQGLEPNTSDITLELDSVSVEESMLELEQASIISDEASFLTWFDGLRPSMQLLISLFLSYWLNIFANLSMPLYEDWGYLFQQEPPRNAVKLVVKEAFKDFDLQELSSYRFVTASSLHVRISSNINSEIIDDLSSGKAVRFVSKSKRWVQIEYLCPDTGEEKTGWVFARYLSKFEL
ncbi:SH3 domain-containing protein [Vibrio sp. 10N.222.54.B12]|uniref:SH3 domain-containing protein n=1 Tax=Vibrio sp. 10N.222.54.B12 TaxID=3229636 RepID=UPI003551D961